MGFVLSEEQQMLRDSAMAFVAERLPVAALRALRSRDGGRSLDLEVWREMADLGFAGVLIPEAFGGSAFGHVGLGQILEAQGRTLAATPLLSTALIGASALLLGGSEQQKADHLPAIVSGERTFALAFEESAHHDPAGCGLTAERVAGGYRLTGDKTFVVDAPAADMFIVSARTSGQAGDRDGVTLFLIPASAAGLSLTPLEMLDAHPAGKLRLDGVAADEASVLGEKDRGLNLLERILDRAAIGAAAEMLGAAEAAFEMTNDYLKVRKQFGQLIGSFQALQHRAAIMFTELELTRSAVMAALDAVDRDTPNVAELASLAKARAGETLHLVTNETVQMHGGIGMTDAHDAGLFLKRARVLEAMFGSESYHRSRYAMLNNF
jgi:alkylation response protein AidB-like acyl-CoA dehydrogenase